LKKRAAVILASGKGTRMKSDLPKVLHLVGGKPMVSHVVDSAKGSGLDHLVVVVGYGADEVLADLSGSCDIVFQSEQLGTGHAVGVTKGKFDGFHGTILVLAGDVPLISTETIKKLFVEHEKNGAAVTVLTAVIDNPTGYGRIIRDDSGSLERIVEEKDATDEEKSVREVNTGTYCFDSKILFDTLKHVTNDNAQGEYYLTDVISLAKQSGHIVIAVPTDDADEIRGVNTLEQLFEIEKIYNQKRGE